MNRTIFLTLRPLVILITVTIVNGCVNGGRVVSEAQISGSKTVAIYHAKDSQNQSVTYRILESANGLSCTETSSSGKNVLATTHWVSSQADHFVLWLEFLSRNGPAVEMVFPKDRGKDGLRYFYPAGTYSILTINGQDRPVPLRRENHTPDILHRIEG